MRDNFRSHSFGYTEARKTSSLFDYWHLLESNLGTPPFERANHTAVLTSDNKIIIYGGHDSIGNLLNDLISYDIERNSWNSIAANRKLTRIGRKMVISDKFPTYHIPQPFEPCPSPPARSNHTAILFNQKMWIFGGNTDEIDGRTYVFEINHYTWTVFIPKNPPEDVISPRIGHSAVLWGDNMVIFGGTNGSTVLPSTILILDLKKLKWSILNCHLLQPNYDHSSFIRNESLFIVGGASFQSSNGFLAVSLKDGSLLNICDLIPDTLNANRRLITATYDPIDDQLYLFGGYTINEEEIESGCSNHLDILNFSTQTYGTLYSDICIKKPNPKCGHVSILYNKQLYIFGGCNRLPLLNGEWVFCDFSSRLWKLNPPKNKLEFTNYCRINN